MHRMQLHVGRALAALTLSSALAGQSVLRTIQGPAQDFGRSLAVLPDVDGDGVAEVAVGASSTNQQTGAVYAHSLATGALVWTRPGSSMGDQLGASLALVGDFDNDGRPDVAAGAPFSFPNGIARAGRVQVLSSATGAVLANFLGTLGDGYLGTSVGNPGDWNGDGTPDVVAGGRNGRVTLFSGEDASALLVIQGPSVTGGAEFGRTLAVLGDWTGDGKPELAIGSPWESVTFTNEGAVHVYSGTGALLYTRRGSALGHFLGESVAAAQDFDGDGAPDLLAGGSWPASGGLVRVYSGPSGALLHESIGTEFNEHHGAGLAACGDLDGDGRSDFAVSAPDHEVQVSSGGWIPSVGAVRWYSSVDGHVMGMHSTGVHDTGTGWTLVPAPDLDGDGLGEVLASESYYSRVAVLSTANLSPARLTCFGDGTAGACPCGNTSPPGSGGCRNSTGTGGRLEPVGAPSIAGGTFALRATQVPSTTSVLFFQGTHLTGTAPMQDGLLCADGVIRRLATRAAIDGVVTYPQGSEASIAFLGQVTAGAEYVYQGRYRNLAGPCGFLANTTNAVRAVWSP